MAKPDYSGMAAVIRPRYDQFHGADAGAESPGEERAKVIELLRGRRLPVGSDLVFPNRDGDPLEPANFRRTWREARGEKRAELEPQAFRRAVATFITREKDSMAAAAAGPQWWRR